MRSGRLLTLLLLLQSRGRTSATQLAESLEVSVRTVLRDLDELSASGVPVRAVRGADGGFELMEGWRTRLTGLTPSEAQALFVAGAEGPAAQLGLGADARTAQLKLIAALPEAWQEDARRVASRFHLDAVGWYRREERLDHLPAVADAVWRDRRLVLRYESWKGVVERRIEPLGLVVKAGEWYLVAMSGGSARTYKVSNIRSLEAGDTFARPRRFDLSKHWAESLARFEAGLYQGTATVRASPLGIARLRKASAAVSEAIDRADAPDGGNASEDGAKKWRTVVIPIESVEHAAGEILRLGGECEVLAPAALREMIAAEAAAIAGLYEAKRPATRARRTSRC